MMRWFKKFRWIIFILSISSCNHLSVDKYQVWLNENKGIFESSIYCNNTKMKLEYIPTEIIKFRSGLEDEDINEEFIFTITLDVGNPLIKDPSTLNQYLELFINEDLKLIQGKDTIPCSYSLLEAGLINDNNRVFKTMLFFEEKLKRNSSEIKVIYSDKILSCRENILFDFPELKISQLPKIKN